MSSRGKLAAFVRNRLDEWSQLANAAWPDNPWETAPFAADRHVWPIRAATEDPHATSNDDHVADVFKNAARADHIVAHDPATVLRHVTALRTITDGLQTFLERDHQIMAAIAATWSNHPDYDPSWTPH